MSTQDLRKRRKHGAKQIDWEWLGYLLSKGILEMVYLDCFISSAYPLICYLLYMDKSFYELVREFADRIKIITTVGFGLLDGMPLVELLDEMPVEVYKKYGLYVKNQIMRLANMDMRNYRPICEKECGNDEQCIKTCIINKIYES
jgi:hypothetical protein